MQISHIKRNTKTGAAMMIVIVFFMFISITILAGIVTPAVREFRIAGTIEHSKIAYALAESGAEDAMYRIKNNKSISASETITIGSDSATTTITSVSGSQKNIVSTGAASTNERIVSLIMRTGDGIVFRYGSQAGKGGIVFKNNAGLLGSFYSNGSITGSNGSYITGDAYVANQPAAAADQTNMTPIPPTSSITFGNANSTQDVGQSFQLTSSGYANSVELYIKKVGTPANATVRIVTNSGTSPSTTTVAQGTLNAGLVSTSYGTISVALSTNPMMLSGVTYWVVVDASTNASSYYLIGANTTYSGGAGKIGQYSGSWNATSPSGLDAYFAIYLGGQYGLLDNVDVGQGGTGDVVAHTVTNATISGSLYCQTGSGNNKACNTSEADPPQVDLPISDANIADWKADAAAGGTISGNYTVSTAQSLGPKKIAGNLIVNAPLTLTDTIWVTGTVTINSSIILNASYGASTGIIISDGAMTTANNVLFQDSGTSGSYIMLLSTSVCDEGVIGNPCGSSNAMNIQNNSAIIIASAPYGAVSFSNNAGVKEIVANKIYLQNNSTVSYGSGLININFSSGPTGAWNLSSWQETQ